MVLSASGTSVTFAPAGPEHQLSITYDSGTSMVLFDMHATLPRSLHVASVGLPGELAFPPFFNGRMLASGDIRTTAEVPLSLTIGATRSSLPVVLTTALATAGGVVVEGAPLGADGRFTMVGAAPGPLPEVGGSPVFVRLTCQATPVPDLDQFRHAAKAKRLSGSLKGVLLKLRMTFATEQEDAPDFAAAPAALRVSAGGVAVGATSFAAGGLTRRGRAFVAEGGDGSRLSLRVLRRRAPARYVLAARLAGARPPGAGGTGVQVTFEAGGILTRHTGRIRIRGARPTVAG
jgi:hypothetical protein